VVVSRRAPTFFLLPPRLILAFRIQPLAFALTFCLLPSLASGFARALWAGAGSRAHKIVVQPSRPRRIIERLYVMGGIIAQSTACQEPLAGQHTPPRRTAAPATPIYR
jgi:hypothetical protein